jgi:hypothetical protein
MVAVGVMIVVIWLTLTSSWRLRNWRAAVLASAGTVGILVTGALPSMIAPWLQTGIWGLVLYALLLRPNLVEVMASEESEFVSEYVRILQSVGRLKRLPADTDTASYVARFEAAVQSMERLEAPAEWAQLQHDTTAELGRRLTMMNLLVKPSREVRLGADSRWVEIEGRFRQLLRERASFWRDFPRLIKAK